jgi:hypothetical protein
MYFRHLLYTSGFTNIWNTHTQHDAFFFFVRPEPIPFNVFVSFPSLSHAASFVALHNIPPQIYSTAKTQENYVIREM